MPVASANSQTNSIWAATRRRREGRRNIGGKRKPDPAIFACCLCRAKERLTRVKRAGPGPRP
jgi:hypothetical protein